MAQHHGQYFPPTPHLEFQPLLCLPLQPKQSGLGRESRSRLADAGLWKESVLIHLSPPLGTATSIHRDLGSRASTAGQASPAGRVPTPAVVWATEFVPLQSCTQGPGLAGGPPGIERGGSSGGTGDLRGGGWVDGGTPFLDPVEPRCWAIG